MAQLTLHSLANSVGARRKPKCVGRGRGSGSGKTCGRGHKGQYARSGHKHKPGFEGGQMRLIRRIPKRGFNRPDKRRFALVPVGALSRFDDGADVTPESLAAAGLVADTHCGVKLLGDGELTRKLRVKAHAFSAGARSKIERAGGACEVIKTP